jgi:hypothetical protein
MMKAHRTDRVLRANGRSYVSPGQRPGLAIGRKKVLKGRSKRTGRAAKVQFLGRPFRAHVYEHCVPRPLAGGSSAGISSPRSGRESVAQGGAHFAKPWDSARGSKLAKRATESGAAARSFARFAGSCSCSTHPGFRKARFTLGHTLSPALRALEFGLSPITSFTNYGGFDREAFRWFRVKEIVEAKPQKFPARNAGASNKAQGEASVVGERDPGLKNGNRKPTKWAREVGRSCRGVRHRVPMSGLRSPAPAGSVLIGPIPRVQVRTSLRFGAPLYPGLYSSRPRSRAWVGPKEGQAPEAAKRALDFGSSQSPRSGRESVAQGGARFAKPWDSAEGSKPAKRATEAGAAARPFARFAGSCSSSTHPGFRKTRSTLGHTLSPALRALEFGLALITSFTNYGGLDREGAFLWLRVKGIVEAKPEKFPARNAGGSNKAQGEASVVGERNPGLKRRNRKPTKWARETVRSCRGRRHRVPMSGFRSPALAGSVLIGSIPRVPLRTSLRFGASLHPGNQCRKFLFWQVFPRSIETSIWKRRYGVRWLDTALHMGPCFADHPLGQAVLGHCLRLCLAGPYSDRPPSRACFRPKDNTAVPAKRATEAGAAARPFARFAGSCSCSTYPGFRKTRSTLGHTLSPAPRAGKRHRLSLALRAGKRPDLALAPRACKRPHVGADGRFATPRLRSRLWSSSVFASGLHRAATSSNARTLDSRPKTT